MPSEEIVTRADPGDAILLIVRPHCDRDRPIRPLPLHCCAISIVVEPPNFGGNTADKLLDDLDAVLKVVSMGELIDILTPGDGVAVG